MNILFVSGEFPSRTDPHRAVFNRGMLRGLAERHHVRVVCPVAWTDGLKAKREGTAPPLETESFPVSYPWFFFPPRVALHQRADWMWWSVGRSLVRAAREHRPDVVLSYWAHPDGEVALRVARRVGVPVALMVGGSDVLMLKEPRRRRKIEAVLRGVDAVITIGARLREAVMAVGVPADRVTSVMRPVDARFVPGDRLAARQKLGLAANQPVLLWVGRLTPVKAVDVLLRAAATLRDRHAGLRVCLVGDGEQAASLRALADELGITSHVNWAGAVLHADLPDWYRAAVVTVLTSLSEGVPNVLLESVACGTPFVASHVGSIPEIADPRCDRLVPVGQVQAFADSIDEVLSHRDDRPARVKGVASNAEFQATLDDVLVRSIAAAPARGGATPQLRSATMVKPNRWRQLARTALLGSVPTRLLVASGSETSRAVCLTFDDGPHETVTTALLDILKRHDARATFFVRGDRADERPEIVRRIVADGHLLGHHSWSHSLPDRTSASQLLAEVRRTRAWLQDQFGKDFVWFRPPHGKVSAAKIMGLWAAGVRVALWNVDPGDVFRSNARELVDWFAANPPRAGDVVLMHDTTMVTVEALPDIIAMVRAAGLELTTLDRCGQPGLAS